MLSLIKQFNEKIGFPLRCKYLVYHLFPYLQNVNKVLDLGSAEGRLVKELSKKLPNLDFVGIDLHSSRTFIHVKKYDGKKIPFPDNSFDCVMIIDVLHHIEHPEEILQEVRRVSKKYVLIKDHYWKNKIDFLILKHADYIGNKPYGIALPYNFLRISDWRKIIKKTNFKISKSEKFKFNFFDPCNHIIYLLEK
jgi:SAM-dependent methyltransferase